MDEQQGRQNILIIGAGSIGRRHAQNCAHLGANVSIHDVAHDHLAALCREKGYIPVYDLDTALKHRSFDAALVCTPNHLHIPFAQKIADAEIDLFIEKPLSHNSDGVDELVSTIERNQLITMAGFNLRFEPGLQFLKKNVDPRKVAFAQIESGSHMPGWRSGVDYRKVYSANKSMGGGIILDDVHELDYACWLFGYPDSVLCSFGQFSNFEIDVEDTASYHFRYADKLVTIHSDYLQKRYTRKCKICYRDGSTTEWVFGDRVVDYHDGEEQVFLYKDRFDINDSYIEEIQTFMQCIRDRTIPESDIVNAAKILKIALEAKSMNEGVFPR
jgi:predicted dehydrogenase